MQTAAVDRACPVRHHQGVAHSALYFPYIEVPQSAPLARVLLYWDELGSIIPEGFRPTGYSARTRELVDTGLVRPVDPQRYWRELDGLADDFLSLVDDAMPNP